MTQAARRLTFEEYLNLEDLDNLPEGRCEFVNEELVEVPLLFRLERRDRQLFVF